MAAAYVAALESDALGRHAGALVRASARKSYDPFTAVDWSEPFDDRRFYLPPRWLPLYGSRAWERMSEPERVAYSRHELAALAGSGIWLENILMRLVVDRLYQLEPTDPTLRYLLVEIADECRHSAMFGELVRRAGTPAYRPSARVRLLGRFARSAYDAALGFVAILAAEELLDAVNRETARDFALHPVSRQVARIHVIEEARHVSFAKAWLERELPRLGRVHLGAIRYLAPLTASAIADATVNPMVYRELGIRRGAAIARDNPNHRQRVMEGFASLVKFLEGVGVVDEGTRPVWEELGLAPERPRLSRRPAPGIVAPALGWCREVQRWAR